MARILAIGDIHGCLTALDTLLGFVRPGPTDQLVSPMRRTVRTYVASGSSRKNSPTMSVGKGGRMAELVVVGGPERSELVRDPEARRLAELARTVGVEDRCHLVGRQSRASVAAQTEV